MDYAKMLEKTCPIIKDDCLGEYCGWFCRYTDKCGIVSLAISLENIYEQGREDTAKE